MSPRSRSWLWISALALAATALVGWRIVRLTWARLRPGAQLVLRVDSAHPFDERMPPDEALRRTLAILRDRVEKAAPTALVAVDGPRLEVQLARGAPVELIAHLLTRTGRLEFCLVDDGSDYMKRVAALPAAHADGIELGRDTWTEKDGGAAHEDLYLRARDAKALTAAWSAITAALPLPPDRAVAFAARQGGADEDAPTWRSYLVYRHADVTGDGIDDAEVAWDGQTGRPEVSLTFNADAARSFEALTARAVGRKLAILLEGKVSSAPVIEGKIAGGHARITMGGYTDPFQLHEEAKDLTAVLRSGATAAPVELLEIRPPPR